MIVEYDDAGCIFHIMGDPVRPEIRQIYAEKESGVLILDPLPGEPVQVRTPTGEAVFDEHGKPVMTEGSKTYQRADIQTDYVKDGVLSRRPECPAKINVTGRKIALTALLPGTTVSAQFEGETVQIEDTSIELDEAGPITIIITPPFPYLEARHDLEIE